MPFVHHGRFAVVHRLIPMSSGVVGAPRFLVVMEGREERSERLLFNGNRGPLSAVKDMIGSQATKGMHVLAKFAPRVERCGVWTDGASLRAIETYPAACRRPEADKSVLDTLQPLNHDDLVDARVCALVACLFANTPDVFEEPPADVPAREGWIWVPKPGKMQELLTGRTRLV